jgi:hypothetical protein
MSSESVRVERMSRGQVGLVILFLGCTLSCASSGDPASSSAPERTGTPATAGSPSTLLRSMTDYLAAQESFSFHAETNFEIFEQGQTLQFAGAADIAIRRPDGMAIDYRDDLSARRVYYDGSHLILVDPLERLYASAEAPADLDAALDYFEVAYDLVMPLTDLIGDDAYSLITSRSLQSRYVGLHDVDGEACHHLAYLGESADLQLWIRDGDSPVPCKMVVDYKEKPGRPAYIAVMMDWEFGQRFPDSHFAPTVPDGARKIEFLEVEEARR